MWFLNITKSRNYKNRPSGPLFTRPARLAGSAVNNNRGSAAIISIVTHLIVYQPRHTSYDAEIQQASTNRRADSSVKEKVE